jgi:lipoprotein-anchoring transpeptidase ErfK/SrfK
VSSDGTARERIRGLIRGPIAGLIRGPVAGLIRGHWRAVLIAALVVALLGLTSAAYGYDRAVRETILPGVRIAGVRVGDMTAAEAARAVRGYASSALTRRVVIRVQDRRWVRSLGDLGVRADIERAVREAVAVSDSVSWASRVYHRLTGRPVRRSVPLHLASAPGPVASLVDHVAAEVARPARNAGITVVSGKLVFQRARAGQALDREAARNRLLEALRSRRAEVQLPLAVVPAKVTQATLGKTITVDLSSRKLRLYDGFRAIRTYDVGTAKRGFLTPPGTWQVIDKHQNPTWTNPDPQGWGKDMPPVIPGGPGNPLGTRALYLDAPGILIHGTPDTASVGGYVSHGCIRMRMWEVEALYPLVPVGTPALVYGAPPWGIAENPGVAGT